jgi:hypothetical protein
MTQAHCDKMGGYVYVQSGNEVEEGTASLRLDSNVSSVG